MTEVTGEASFPDPQTQRPALTGNALRLARLGWFAVAIFSLGLFFYALPFHVIQLRGLVTPAENMALVQLGTSVPFYITYQMVHSLVIMLAFALTAIVIFLYKSDDWMTIFVSLALLMFGVAITPSMQAPPALFSLANRNPAWFLPVATVYTLGIGSILFVLYLFPDGRFVPHITKPAALFWMVWLLAFSFLPNLSPAASNNTMTPLTVFVSNLLGLQPKFFETVFTNLRYYTLSVVLAFWFGSGVLAQMYRYLRVSTPAQRHQTKWAVFGSSLAVILYFGLYLPLPILVATDQPVFAIMRYHLVAMPIATLALLLFPLSLAVSMLRFRLWDVDFLINRTLVYGGLTSVLTVLYLGGVLISQAIFSRITQTQSTVAVAITTLIISSLFQPLRRRFQNTIDRRFYREKVNFRQVFTDFAQEVRTIIHLPELLRMLVTRTAELLHIEYGAVFLQDESRSGSGIFQLSESVRLPWSEMTQLAINEKLLGRLREGQVISQPRDPAFPMLVPLLAPQGSNHAGNATPPLLGVLALGPLRSGLHYNREDQALLLSLADQGGTAIYVAQLIQETQDETRRREEAEERLEAHRSSPIGRAESMAQSILAQPDTAISDLHRLTTDAGKDPVTANLLGNLPKVLASLNAGALAELAEGYNYIFNSQYTPELLPIGLRTLVAALNSTGDGGERPLAPAPHEAIGALHVYRVCLAAYDANSVAQITAIKGVDELESMMENPCDPADTLIPCIPLPDALTPLINAAHELHPVMDALHAYERVDTASDKLAYLASAIHNLRHVDHLARTELGSADRFIMQQVVESWLAIVTSAMSELQTSARIVCQLLTRNTWQGDIVSLVLSLSNQGRGAALQVKVNLVPAPEYTLLDESTLVERLAPGEEAQVQLRVRPRLSQNVDHFRARFVILYTDPRGPDQVENFADVVHLLSAGGEFQHIPNPYVVGTPLQTNSPLFFGREEVVHSIHENLSASHRNNLVLIGQRRTGKTSLLKQLPARLDDSFLPVYLDGQTLGLDPGLPNFFLTLATEIAFALEDRGFEIDPPELQDFQDSPSAAFERGFLERVRGLIGDRHLLIMFDEFEELESAVHRGNLDASIFGFLRHLIQHSPNLSVIFCGTHRIEQLAADYWSILFNISLYQHIGFLSKPEAARLIQEPVEACGMRYDDLALDKIWRITAGHPYFLQLLCHSLVNRHNKTGRSYVTIADVNEALDEILASGEAHFVYLWTESTPEERLALAAISRMMPLTGQITAVQLIDYINERGITIERQVVSQALHHLTLRDILQSNREGDGGLSDSYRWKLGLLGLWVEKYKSLSRVVDEVRGS